MSLDRPLKLSIKPGHTLLLGGPAQLVLRRGDAESFGAPFQTDIWTTIEDSKQEPIFSVGSADLELKLGPGSSWADVPESTIPLSWEEAAQILHQQSGTAVVIGEVDSGKSSLCTFLANKCLEHGMNVGLIDADVGQADLGPPTTISSTSIRRPVSDLQNLKAETTYFVGDTTPSSVPDKLIRLVALLKKQLTNLANVVIVNTDGWIGDLAAVRFKLRLLEEIQPALVLGLARNDEINALLDSLRFATLRLPVSNHVKIRSKEERKRNRESAYRRFLLGSKLTRFSLEMAVLRSFDHPEQSVFRGGRRFRGNLAGLLNEEQKLLGIGRIRDMNSQETILETFVEDPPRFLEVGNIVLSSSYEEVGYGMLH